ncbi:MAG TPA: NTP transferase domain-containing protein [Thermoplasmata archaeon]|nr:NTP transferase domain-containing protein [Thermoplasmata archaeon]
MISAIVLAAGSSSRMGEPKPLVALGGRALLSHVLETLRGSRVEGIVLVLGDSASRVRHELPLEGVTVVENPSYWEGMSSSLRKGIAALDPAAEAFFVVLGDEPFVRSETFDALIAAREASASRIILPTYGGVRGNPVLLDRSLSAEADRLTGDRGCRALHERHPTETREVPVDDPGVLIDLDTPEEVERARETLREGRPLSALVEEFARRPLEPGRPSSVANPTNPAGKAPAEGPGGAAQQLVVIGDSRVSESLCVLGRLLGFRVIMAGPDLEPTRYPSADELVREVDELTARLDSATYAVVATMAAYDVSALATLLRSPVAYVGLVANRRRAASLRDALTAEGFSASAVARIHSPAGLDIHAETPEEIGLSVAADLVSRRRSGPKS